MTKTGFDKVRNTLKDHGTDFMGIGRAGRFPKTGKVYKGSIDFQVEYYSTHINFSFDGSDEGLVNGIIQSLKPYTDLNNYCTTINGVTMDFGENIVRNCRIFSTELITALKPLAVRTA